jgi:hypothetical protein
MKLLIIGTSKMGKSWLVLAQDGQPVPDTKELRTGVEIV